MTIGDLPEDGNVRIGPVTLPPGRRVRNHSGDPVAWATTQPVPHPRHIWSALSGIVQDSGLVPIMLAGLDGTTARPWDEGEFDDPADVTVLDQIDPADVLAEGWDNSLPDEEEDDDEDEPDSLAAELAPFGWQFPGLAPPEQDRLNEAEIQRVLDAFPPARIGLIPADRSADALPMLGWVASDQYPDSLPLAAVLRSWEDRFGARLLEVGFARIRLLVERPPRSLDSAQRIAAEHYAFCDESGYGLTTIPEISASLVGTPIWAFWWD